MAATLSVSRSVKIDGLKGEWNIKDKDTKQCNGVIYVKMCVRSSSLSTMLGNMGGFRCLSRSIGLRKLLELKVQRIEEQLDNHAAAADACTLFDDVPTERPRKVPKMSNIETGSGVELEVNGETVTVEILLSKLKDSLFVAFEAENIQTVIKYIMEAGFDDGGAKKVKKKAIEDNEDVQELPVGIWRQGKGYSVGYTDTNGKKGRKHKNSLEAALRFFADPSEDTSHGDKDELCES